MNEKNNATTIKEDNGEATWTTEAEAGARRTLSVGGVELAFRYCPGGKFAMGSERSEVGRAEDEKRREVELTQGVWMLETPATQAMWEAALGSNPSYFSPSGGGAYDVEEIWDASRFPVENVSWEDCQKFVDALNASGCAPEGWRFRLPTEAEWERACRAGTETPFFWGDSLNGDAANCRGCAPYGTSERGAVLGRPTAVGSYAPNAWGLYDMIGNVREWCADRYGEYGDDETTDPTGAKAGWNRVLRGGSWNDDAAECRAARRLFYRPTYRSPDYGCRVVLAQATGRREEKRGAEGGDGFERGQAAKAGERRALTIDGVEFAFRYCPAGTFWMGSAEDEDWRQGDESSRREIVLTRGFWLLETPTTQEMWRVVMGDNPSWFSEFGGGAEAVAELNASRLPVERVSWDDCQDFIDKLNASGVAPEGWRFRLPTEAEWEYACRAETETPFFWGDALNGFDANCFGKHPYGTFEEGDFKRRTSEVGRYEPNLWGLCDMSGNVCEWCADWYDEETGEAWNTADPTGPLWGDFRVVRGGSWFCDASACRSAFRRGCDPATRVFTIGFRLALSEV